MPGSQYLTGSPARPPMFAGLRGFCLIMAVCYAAFGVVGWAYVLYLSTLPVVPGGFGGSAPSWLASLAALATVFVLVPWLLLPAPLLVAGLACIRRAAAGRRGSAAGWVLAVLAGVAVELSPYLGYPGPRAFSAGYLGPPVPDWAALGQCALFLCVGIAMVVLLAGAGGRRTG